MFQRHRIVTSFLFLLSFAIVTRGIAATVPHKGMPPTRPFVPQLLEGGVWRLDGTFESTLAITNVLSISSVTVTPSLFMQDGTELPLAPVTIAASSVALIDINDAMQHAPGSMKDHLSLFGSVAVSYQGPWAASVLSSVRNVDEIRRITFVSNLHNNSLVAHDKASPRSTRTAEGIWWRQTKVTGGFLSLTDTALDPIVVSVEFFDAAGELALTKQVLVAKHSTVQMDLGPMFDQIKTDRGTLRVTYTGPSYGLAVEGGLEDDVAGYSAGIRFMQFQPDSADILKTISYTSAGVMTGKPDPEMEFPSGTIFAPYSMIANRTNRTITVALSAAFQQGSSSTEKSLPDIQLAPHSTVKTDIAAGLKAAGLDPLEYVNLRFSFMGKEGDLLITAGSVDASNDFVFEVTPVIQAKSDSKIICLWQVYNDTSSMISLWNYAQKDQDFVLTLLYSGGSYKIPVSLAAGVSKTIDVGKLIHQQIPDALGNTIPTTVSQGSAILAGPTSEADLIEVASSTSTFNVRTATCNPNCTSCNGVTNGYMDETPFPLSNGATIQGQAIVGFQTGSSQNFSSNTWNSSAENIATTTGSGMIKAMGGGTTNFTFYITGLAGYTGAGEACSGGGSSCPALPDPYTGEGTGSVTPNITNVTSFVYGGTGIVTITGSGFSGTPGFAGTPTVTSMVGYQMPGYITFSNVTVVNSGMITATYSVACGETVGTAHDFIVIMFAGETRPIPQYPAMVVLPMAPAPSITMGGATVSGVTTSAFAGQAISLNSSIPSLPNTCVNVGTQTWGTPTGIPVGGYTASTSAGTFTPFTASTTGTQNFYWASASSSSPWVETFSYTLTGGGASVVSPMATASFNVAGPTSPTMSTSINPVFVGGTPTVLELGNYPAQAGEAFLASATIPPSITGSFQFVQLITTYNIAASRPQSQGNCSYSPGYGLDNTYPYPANTPTSASDSPDVPFFSDYIGLSVSFNATMYLMWKPSSSTAIPIPLGYVGWGWSGNATGSSPNWTLQSSTTNAGVFVPSTTYPTWTTLVTNMPAPTTCR